MAEPGFEPQFIRCPNKDCNYSAIEADCKHRKAALATFTYSCEAVRRRFEISVDRPA